MDQFPVIKLFFLLLATLLFLFYVKWKPDAKRLMIPTRWAPALRYSRNSLATLFVMGANSSSQNNPDQFLECLNSQYQSSIYTPANASYSFILQSSIRNHRPGSGSTSTRKPLAIITPLNESEIQAAIHCSREHGVQLRVRSGGHDYEGLSYISESPFFIVDMRNFRSISIDTQENTAWVQTGATLGQLYYTIAQTSKTLAFTAGVCLTVGVGGHFSGGGYGMMSRKHGIAIDHIIDAKVIDANGRVLDREAMGEDLFWAIRGGGGTSFGIIIAFKVKLIVVPEIVTVFNVPRTLEENATQLVYKWQYIAHKVDDNLLIRLILSSVRSPQNRGITILASFTSLFLGRVRDLLPIMQENFPELGLKERDCIEMSWIESTLFFPGFHNESLDVLLNTTLPHTTYFKGKSDYVTQPIPEYGLEGIWKFLSEVEYRSQLQFSPYGGILNTVSESETPFPHRSGNIFMIHYGIGWLAQEQTESQSHINWIQRLYRYMAPYVSKSPRAAYFNYRDLDIGMNNEGNYTSIRQASVWGFKYFKNNFDRLVSVKTKVDPSNFFRNEQSIPPRV